MALVVAVCTHMILQGEKAMNPETARAALNSAITKLTDCKWLFCRNPEKDFTRERKLPFEKTVSAILSFRGGTLNHDLLDFFGLDPALPTSPAFIQQRSKILPEAFETLFHLFTDEISQNNTYKGFRLLAIDGSDLQIASNPDDPDSFYSDVHNGKPCNLLHINAMYDLCQHLYLDAVVQKYRHKDESLALTTMVDRYQTKKALVMADRGFESYNNLAHIQEKGWSFLIRAKSSSGIVSGFQLPDSDCFDVPFHLNITRSRTNAVKELLLNKNAYKCIPQDARLDFLPAKCKRNEPAAFYTLHFRVVRFPISDTENEIIITNLNADEFPMEEVKRLYGMRWGIETSFRDLKHTLALLHLHAKKVEFILQEIFAKFVMYNFCELITQSVVIQQGSKKYAYKVNFSDAAHICLQFFRGDIPPPDVEALLLRFISPIRPGRKDARKLSRKPSVSFLYRVA